METHCDNCQKDVDVKLSVCTNCNGTYIECLVCGENGQIAGGCNFHCTDD